METDNFHQVLQGEKEFSLVKDNMLHKLHHILKNLLEIGRIIFSFAKIYQVYYHKYNKSSGLKKYFIFSVQNTYYNHVLVILRIKSIKSC